MEHPPGAGDAAGREEVDIEIHCPGIETVEEEDSGVLDDKNNNDTFFNEQSGSQGRAFQPIGTASTNETEEDAH